MPTENPKISLYVPQQIYDRFIEFKDKQKLSMSQAGTVILAEYFGIEETIKEITEGTTIGGVTLARIEKIEKEIQELRSLVDQTNNISSLLVESKAETVSQEERTEPELLEEQDKSTSKLLKKNTQTDKQFELIENSSEISIRGDLLAKRLGLAHPKSLSNRRIEIYKDNNSEGDTEFYSYTQKKDFDGIGWKPLKIKNRYEYIPIGELSSELLERLQKWIAKNKEDE